MPHANHVLAIDQGTTSTRAMVFDAAARRLSLARRELAQHYPAPGWVEHDAEDIWRDTRAVMAEALAQARLEATSIAAIGLTNQRETVVMWERATGRPIHRALVWQDRRTAPLCERLRSEGVEPLVRARTGLLLDPYFSATKIAWLLDELPGIRARAERGELACGTIETYLLWRLTDGAVHATDPTNASRTLLFDIHRGTWDEELLEVFRVPRALLPSVHESGRPCGATAPHLLGGAVLIGGVAGDQQAALVGQACLEPGMAKSTYGTGCFLLLHTGARPVPSAHRLLTTPTCAVGGQRGYALEGSIFVAGAAMRWLRDALRLLGSPADSAAIAQSVPDTQGVYLVPAFVGLGAPHWEPGARGLICGLGFDTSAAHIVRAALESVAYQTLDLTRAMQQDGAQAPRALRIDGGMAGNDWFCQFLADMLAVPVERPAELETTALGAAFLAGLTAGVWPDAAALARTWSAAARFTPQLREDERMRRYEGWQQALRRALA